METLCCKSQLAAVRIDFASWLGLLSRRRREIALALAGGETSRGTHRRGVATTRELGVADDIAAGVRYLAGSESGWVTGQSIGIEGGNELTKAPYLEDLVRMRFGDDAIDAALAGRIPG